MKLKPRFLRLQVDERLVGASVNVFQCNTKYWNCSVVGDVKDKITLSLVVMDLAEFRF